MPLSLLASFLGASAKTRHTAPALLIGVLGFGGSPTASAQLTDSLRQGTGEWRAHTTFSQTTDAAACGEYVAWATPGAVVLRYHDGEVRRFDKASGLRQARVEHVACAPDGGGPLVIGYEDGALEVIDPDRANPSVHYATGIADARIAGRRDVNRVRALGGERYVIAADFGFLFFDAGEGIFGEDVRFPERVEDVAVFGDDLYVATWEGLRVLRDFERRPTALRDTNAYESLEGIAYEGPQRCFALGLDGGRLLAGFRERLVAIGPGASEASVVAQVGGADWRDIRRAGNRVLAAAKLRTGTGRVLVREGGGDFRAIDVDCASIFEGAAVAPGGQLVYFGVGPSFDGSALMYAAGAEGACRVVELPGPRFPTVFDVDARDGVVAVAAGGYGPNFGEDTNFDGAAVLRDGDWEQYNDRTRERLRRGRDLGNPPFDYVSAAVGSGGDVFLGTFSEGVYRISPGAEEGDEVYDTNTSSLEVDLGATNRIRVLATELDARDNLWVATQNSARPLSVRTAGGEWYSYSVAACGGDRSPRRLTLVEDGRGGLVVYAANGSRGLLAYDTRGTLADDSDDVCRVFGTNDGLPDTDIRSLATDLDGVVWAGTNNGIATVSCPGDVTDGQACRAQKPQSLNVDDGIRSDLFSGESIRAIAVDGGNRKWIGTAAGLFLLDDVRDNPQIAAFDEDNSPLLDSEITALSYDGSTGTLWAGTAAGLVSYQTDATAAEPFAHADAVEIFPQPVRPDYDGPITIRGLARDSNVKITDTQGRLVFESDATGGTATWDGRDYTGRPAVTGVYFVWGTATAAARQPETVVGKIALVR